MGTAPTARPRGTAPVVHAGPESEFGVPAQAVTLESLIAALPSSAAIPRTLRDSALTLDLPTPKRIDQQTTRSVAFEQAKESLEKWVPTVTANRKAEHLSFPLGINNARHAQSSAALVDAHAPSTDLEREVAMILGQSAAVEKPGQRLTRGEELELQRAFMK